MDRDIRLIVLLLACVLLSLMPMPSAAADGQRIATLTLTNGLAGETVNSLVTDHSGIVWAATNSGVSAYDGRRLHTFRIPAGYGQPAEVYALCETSDRHVWAATESGLYRLTLGESRFERVLPEVTSAKTLLAVGDTVYIGGEQGFMMYDGQTLHHQDLDVSRSGLTNIVRQYVRGNDGRIWFLGRNTLHSYDPISGKTTAYPIKAEGGKSVILTQFCLAADSRQFFIGTSGDGLYRYDIATGIAIPVDGTGKIVSSVLSSADGHICVATDGDGAYLLDAVSGQVVSHFSTEAIGRFRLPANGLRYYCRDLNGIDWFGFVRHGLAYTYYSGNLFQPVAAQGFTTEGINVRSYLRHGDDAIIGTQDGFYYLNHANGQHRYFTSEELGGGHIVNCLAWHEGEFYIGTFDGGLRVFNPQTQQLHRQTFSPLLDERSIGDLKTDSAGRLWIGSSHGLFIVTNGKVEKHFTEQNSHIVGGLILSITLPDNGDAWLTGASGCSLYSAGSGEIVKTDFPEGFFNRQPWMRGARGHDGLVFMRTGPQTFYTDSSMEHFGALQLPIAFRDKWCRAFIDDMAGYYVLSSERGVFRFDYALKEMYHFGYSEGLRGEFINDMGVDTDGRLWVGTSEGLFKADSCDLKTWKADCRFKVRLTDIRRGSDLMDVPTEYMANETGRLRLTWNITSQPLEAEPLLLDYSRQHGRLYEYRIDGGEWQLLEGDKPLQVRGLLLGTHRLEVRLLAADGTTSAWTLSVVPSAWAIVELLLIIVSLVLLWLWWRYRKNTRVMLHERDEIEDALMESEEIREKMEELVSVGDETPQKYSKVKVNEEECASIVSRMKEYIEREHVYTNADLKMKDLADVLHLSAPKLSQVFNLYMETSYYDFINQYRLAEFKRLIEAGELKRYTITALSERCGFKKSNFFSTFRKVEGMTPAEYLKKQGIAV